MTVVNLTVDETALGGPVGTDGRVIVEYVAGSRGYIQVDGDRVVLPKPVTVRFTDGVFDAPLDLEPTRGVCAAAFVIRVDSGRSLRRVVEIPETGPVDFGDLVVVDPDAFAPGPADQTLRDWILLQITELTTDRF